MNIDKILEISTASILLIEERARKNIVIGVPHHAPLGTLELPCREHRNSDENAGYLGRYLAGKLGCCSIVACNYSVDVNKCLRSDYTMQIAAWNPMVLVEIHGHSGKNANSDIEISSGSTNNNKSCELANILKEDFLAYKGLKTISVCGEYSKLHFKASKAVTISDGRWLAYHIELPPILRKPNHNACIRPPDVGYQFCDILAEALGQLHD